MPSRVRMTPFMVAFFITLSLWPLDVTVAAAAPPSPPAVYLDTTFLLPTGTTRQVSAGGDFQAALNAAQPGDVILLEGGATFIGNFTLPKKTGSGWIYVMTSKYAMLPPPGTRVGPGDAAVMAKIVTAAVNTAALSTTDGAHHYRFVGIEITKQAGVVMDTLVTLGDGVNGQTAQTTLAQVPTDIVFDRSYIHGLPTEDTKRGVLLNSARTAIIDSYISDIHMVGNGDTQALCGWNGPGPFKIVNNYLSSAGENVEMGGPDASIPNLVPSDMEIRGNYFFKPQSWKVGDPSYAGIHWGVKNLFELKNGQRILFTGNTLQNNWIDAQNGFALLLTPFNTSGTNTWATVSDITITGNTFINVPNGFNVTFSASGTSGFPDSGLHRVLIQNNQITGSVDTAFQILNGPDSVTIDHNTAFATSTVIVADGRAAAANFVFTNNIMGYGNYGVIGNGTAPGNGTINTYFPGAVFTKNLFVGANATTVNYPAGNFAQTDPGQVGFMNYAGGDYRLTATSPYHNAGTDGKDLGAVFASTGALPPPSNLSVR